MRSTVPTKPSITGKRRIDRIEIVVAHRKTALQQRRRLKRDRHQQRIRYRVALGRELEVRVGTDRAEGNRCQRCELVTKVHAVGRVDAVQRRLQVSTVVRRIGGERGLQAGRGHTDVRPGQGVKIDGPADVGVGPSGTGVDLEAGPVLHVDKARVDLERHARARHRPTNLVDVADVPFAGVLLVPVERFGDVGAEPGRAQTQPEIALRRQREGEVLFRVLVGRIVEHVVIDSDVCERDRRVQHQRTETHADGRRIRGAVAGLGARRRGAQEQQHDQDGGQCFWQ